jgi:hypothetical protein
MKDIPFILVFNKQDLLARTLRKYPLENYFCDYVGGDDVDNAIEFIRHMYLRQYEGNEKSKLISVVTSMIDEEQTSNVIDVIAAVVL